MMRGARAAAAALLALGIGLGAAACAGRPKQTRLDRELAGLDARGLYERGLEYLARRDLTQARRIFERIEFLDQPDLRQELEPLVRLALADTTFYQRGGVALIDARSLYLDFVTLYGTHPLAPYAQLQAGLCSLEQVYAPSRDQTQTLQALADLEEVVRRWPDSPFAEGARNLQRRAQENLAQHELQVGEFYMTKKAYEAAAERFRRVLELYPAFEDRPRALYQLGRAHVLNKNAGEATVYLQQLVAEYADSELAGEARRLLSTLAPAGAAAAGNGHE
jgi:outer membrane protein assembly factor BamD